MSEIRVDPIRKLHTFTVTGHGEFPLDMLRYDSCWPKSESSDVVAIGMSFNRRVSRQRITVQLIGIKPPTEGRWQSFGWKVTTT